MNALLLILLAALCSLQLALPRKWAMLPLLAAAVHTPPVCQIGGFTCARIVIIVGLARAVATGMLRLRPLNILDKLMAVFAVIVLLSAFMHDWTYTNPLIFRIGLLLNIVGTYLYGRAYLADGEVLAALQKCLLIVLVPFALLMAVERVTGRNSYAAVGAKRDVTLVREGKNRAQGPFGTPILAGTVGACVVPLMIPLWRRNRAFALKSLGVSTVIVLASSSSGPLATMMIGSGMVALWWWRHHLRWILWGGTFALIVLHFIKERPVWYLMALMDLVGGSTGWHRAHLIDVGIKRLGEWWLAGTDLTGHWLPYSLPTNIPGIFQADLTNYYLHIGVIAGLPAVIALVAIQVKSFRLVGERIRTSLDVKRQFDYWCVGAAMAAHAVTFLSISYYDQMYVFFWILVGLISTFPQLAVQTEEDDGLLEAADVPMAPLFPAPVSGGRLEMLKPRDPSAVPDARKPAGRITTSERIT